MREQKQLLYQAVKSRCSDDAVSRSTENLSASLSYDVVQGSLAVKYATATAQGGNMTSTKTMTEKLNSSKMEGMEDKWNVVRVVLDLMSIWRGWVNYFGGWLPLIRCFQVLYRQFA